MLTSQKQGSVIPVLPVKIFTIASRNWSIPVLELNQNELFR